MFKKSVMAVMLAVGLIVSSSAVAFAAESETLVSNGWWSPDGVPASTHIALPDAGSVTFEVEVAAPTNPDDTYAAFCVEVSDGTNYFTTTSAGDCWGAPDGIGNVIKDTGKADAEQGKSYKIVVTRDGNNFTATYTDLSTGADMFGTLYFTAKDGTSFADPTVYVMGQVGTMTVKVVEDAAAPAETTETETTTTDVPKTGEVYYAAAFGLGVLAFGAAALKLRRKAQ
ncbi:MAG: hypothetical protein QM644_11240 [Mobilitalea sp.]